MRQQLSNRNVALAVALEAGNIRCHPIAQADAALLDEHHHARRRGDDLGQRRQIEDGVERHRLDRRRDGAIADGLLIEDSIASADEDNRARQLPVGNRLAYKWLDRIEPADVYWSLLLRDTGARAGRHRGHDSKMRSLLFRGHLGERQDQNRRCEAEGHGR